MCFRIVLINGLFVIVKQEISIMRQGLRAIFRTFAFDLYLILIVIACILKTSVHINLCPLHMYVCDECML